MQLKAVVCSSQIADESESKAKRQHVISIEELCFDSKILELEDQSREKLKSFSPPQENYEKDRATLLLTNFKMALALDENDYRPILRARLEDLIARPCAVKAVKDCWKLPFNENSFLKDIEAFSSKLNGIPMKIRTKNVESLDLQTGLTAVRYPSAKDVKRGIPVVASLINEPCCRLPILSALIAWIYLYRLHLFEDGNGRISRHIINISLRNYGVVSEPKIFSSVNLYKNMRVITEHMTGLNPNMRELIIMLYSAVFETSEVELKA